MSRAVLVLVVSACAAPGVAPEVLDAGVRQAAPLRAVVQAGLCDASRAVPCGQAECCTSPEVCVRMAQTFDGHGLCSACPAGFEVACAPEACCAAADVCVQAIGGATQAHCGCPSGATECGVGCCPTGAVCVSGQCQRCPASAPHLCGALCQQAECSGVGPVECTSPSRVCPEGNRCCPEGSNCCVRGGCCPATKTYRGAGECYASLTECMGAGNTQCARCDG